MCFCIVVYRLIIIIVFLLKRINESKNSSFFFSWDWTELSVAFCLNSFNFWVDTWNLQSMIILKFYYVILSSYDTTEILWRQSRCTREEALRFRANAWTDWSVRNQLQVFHDKCKQQYTLACELREFPFVWQPLLSEFKVNHCDIILYRKAIHVLLFISNMLMSSNYFLSFFSIILRKNRSEYKMTATKTFYIKQFSFWKMGVVWRQIW